MDKMNPAITSQSKSYGRYAICEDEDYIADGSRVIVMAVNMEIRIPIARVTANPLIDGVPNI